MGTSWHVTIVSTEDEPSAQALQQGIEAVLDDINIAMSTYRDDSEISRINRAAPGEWHTISAPFAAVLAAALAVGSDSGGAYDVSVAPLVDLWGFGSSGAVQEPPADERVKEVMSRVGQAQLELDEARLRLRKVAQRQLDFSSIAKGYAVDRIADWLLSQGHDRFLVEVGGELKLAGLSPRDDLWRIAIEQPLAGVSDIADAIALTDRAIATSGDYRNFFEMAGVRYSHTLDPRSGYPVSHDLGSVTVVHSSAMLADAWATALTVLGPSEAQALAQAEDLAVYFIWREGDELVSSHTTSFQRYLQAANSGR